ncbi:hypothetical protein ACFY64_09600 [Streptomyces collinus]|uniref:hypothetical protein n=1 Tax=Streptomyces collinus TaxID=42684 RepID=UPI00368D5886
MTYTAGSGSVSSGDVLQLIGSLYGAASIIIVFQMFALQAWYEKVQSLDDASFDLDQRTVVGSLEREALIFRMRSHNRSFPWIQLSSFSAAVVTLLGLAGVLSIKVHELSVVFTGGPAVILLAMFVSVICATRARGRRALLAAIERIN